MLGSHNSKKLTHHFSCSSFHCPLAKKLRAFRKRGVFVCLLGLCNPLSTEQAVLTTFALATDRASSSDRAIVWIWSIHGVLSGFSFTDKTTSLAWTLHPCHLWLGSTWALRLLFHLNLCLVHRLSGGIRLRRCCSSTFKGLPNLTYPHWCPRPSPRKKEPAGLLSPGCATVAPAPPRPRGTEGPFASPTKVTPVKFSRC